VSTISGQLALLMKVNGVDAATITNGWDNFSFEFADGSRMSKDEFLLNFRRQPQTVYGGEMTIPSTAQYDQGGNDTLTSGITNDEIWKKAA
jgi:hypothetical protein